MRPLSTTALLGFVLLFSSGCVNPRQGEIGRGRDKVFIQYWPPPEGSTKTRLAVKDLIDIKGYVTTAGSEYFLKAHQPATQDAACLQIARERGVTIVGKTNLSEFAVAPSGLNDYFGTPRSPLTKRPRLIPGGSSSGSAVAVADGRADIAFGTDTTGSIRLPAAYCGIVGLKTTYGLVSLKGAFTIEPDHLDTIGPMAKDIRRTAEGMDLLERGFAGKYHTAMAAHPNARRYKVGRLYLPGTSPKIDAAVDAALTARGFQIVRLGDDFKKQWEQATSDTATLAAAGAWINDQKFTSQPGVSQRTKAVVLLGRVAYTKYWDTVSRIGTWQATVKNTLRNVDFIALPTAKNLPPRFQLFGRSVLFESKIYSDQNTAAVNLAGNPALSLPIPLAGEEVPVTSLQLIGKWRGEADLLNAGRIIESQP